MEIYTLGSDFQKENLVENFNSVIWTERYSVSGEVQLVVPDSLGSRELLAEGTFLSIPESDELMLIDTLDSEDYALKVSGSTITQFLDERNILGSTTQQTQTVNFTKSPGDAMGSLISDYAINSVFLSAHGPYEGIPNLEMGSVDTSGTAIAMAISLGPLYSAVAQIAQTYGMGFKIYLDHADDSGYLFKATVYKGRDLTSTQSTYPLVRFSEDLETLTNVKELRSIKGYKTGARAWAPSLSKEFTDAHPVLPGDAFVSTAAETVLGFDRRTLMVFASDIRETDFGSDTDPAAAATQIHNALIQRARDGLANNNYTRVVDGEVIPQAYDYGSDFKLGDIVELEAASGDLGRAQITEYIRSQDANGEKEYPTVSVQES